MRDPQRFLIDSFASELSQTYTHVYGEARPEFAAVIADSCRSVLGRVATSDMLYHNVEHSILVVSAGQQILIGKQRRDGNVSPSDWLHFILALLCHDVGYVRGACRGDGEGRFVTGDGGSVTLPHGCTDAALTPYHVSRSQVFVLEHFGPAITPDCDAERIASYIEMTRFPPPNAPEYQATGTYGGLARAADFIGQFSDPHYLRKLPALFYEFEQIGANATHGYTTPGDIRSGFGIFYREVVSPYIEDALGYLGVTAEGVQWVATLQSHVREVEQGTA